MNVLDFQSLLREERQRVNAQQRVGGQNSYHRSGITLEIPADLENFRAAEDKVDNVYYVPSVISQEVEVFLMKEASNAGDWLELQHRKVQNLGGVPHHEGMFEESLPPYAARLADALNLSGVFKDFKVNHALVNEYTLGQGIMPHRDGPNFYPCAAILSLGSSALMDFYEDRSKSPTFSVFLERRSLLVFNSAAYDNFFHGIASRLDDVILPTCCNMPAVEESRSYARSASRISITMRHAYTSNREFLMTKESSEERLRRELVWQHAIAEESAHTHKTY